MTERPPTSLVNFDPHAPTTLCIQYSGCYMRYGDEPYEKTADGKNFCYYLQTQYVN